MPRGKKKQKMKMTEEERILFMEQQRLAEEEIRKNKEDMLAQFLKVGTKTRGYVGTVPQGRNKVDIYVGTVPQGRNKD